MDDDQKPDQEQPAGDPLITANRAENPTPAQPATQQQLQAAEKAIEDRMSAFERSMVRLTRYGLGVTIATAVIFAGQLYELYSGARQTDALIDAADRNALSSRRFATSAGLINSGIGQAVDRLNTQADATKAMSEQALKQTSGTDHLAAAARRQADIAVATLDSQQRPWLAYDHIDMPGKIEKGSTAPNSFFYKNWGAGPAIHVLQQYQISAFCGDFPQHPYYKIVQPPTAIAVMPNQLAGTVTITFPSPSPKNSSPL